MSTPKPETHIFLSYNHKNKDQTDAIRKMLEADGYGVWQDFIKLKGGEEWIKAIDEGIRHAFCLVLVMSKEAWASYWVQEEFNHALRHKKPIIPFCVDDSSIPFGLAQLNWIWANRNFEAGMAKLREAIQKLTDATTPNANVSHRRQLELGYLNKILLEHSVWQTLYTPMAGVAQIRKEKPETDKPKMVTVPTDISTKFKMRLKQAKLSGETPIETEEKPYDDILQAVEDARRIVILGDPGAGKTTSLWKIAADYAERATTDPTAPLPLFIRLGELSSSQSLMDRIHAQLDDLTQFYGELLAEKRLIFLLDGLNEMPQANRETNVEAIRELMKQAEETDLIAAITCRELDYTDALDMKIPERVLIAPLNPVQIYSFIKGYIQEPPEAGDKLFWDLVGEFPKEHWEWFQKDVGESFNLFWAADELPEDKHKLWKWQWYYWLEVRRQHQLRSMLQLATNPFMLYMVTQVYTEEGQFPPNRGALFALFMDFLLIEREGLESDEAETLENRLADLGYEMQRQGEGTTFKREAALRYLSDETSLYRAQSASILTGTSDIRFTHQLLQEYFAAKRLDREMKVGTSATEFFPAGNWWEPQGWEETVILLAGLYSDDCSPVIEWLRDTQPELVARCILESGAEISDETYSSLREAWLPYLTNTEQWSMPEQRASFGRALGMLDCYNHQLPADERRDYLDNRQGVGIIIKDGIALPDIEWVEIPDDGAWIYQKNRHPPLPMFYISRYPVTMAQFQAFIDAEDGLNNPNQDWFAGLAADEKDKRLHEQHYQYWNHPRDNINWYQAVAFCRWLSFKLMNGVPPMEKPLTWLVRLPTEVEWEKAARGTDGREYAYGYIFDAKKGNVYETGIGETSVVGMFPHGASPYGVMDMSGNMLEWCLTEYDSGSNNVTSKNARVKRSSWFSGLPGENARVSVHARGTSSPDILHFSIGFRVVSTNPPLMK